MKNLKLFLVAIILIVSAKSFAQVAVNVNIGAPPAWGPAGYTSEPYYYLPDVESYYDVRASQFIYFGGGRWHRSRYLPGPYRNYDLYNGYKVVLTDYRGNSPYSHFHNHKTKYHKGYHGKPQKNIGVRHHNKKHYSHHNDGHRNHGNHGNKGNKGHGNKGRGNNGDDDRRGKGGHGRD